MPPIELEKLDIQGLRDAIAKAQALLAKKQEAAKAQVLNRWKTEAEELGLDFDELVRVAPKQRRARAKAEPKYQHPENPEITWSARGRMPGWAKEYDEAGKLEELRIKKD